MSGPGEVARLSAAAPSCRQVFAMASGLAACVDGGAPPCAAFAVMLEAPLAADCGVEGAACLMPFTGPADDVASCGPDAGGKPCTGLGVGFSVAVADFTDGMPWI